MISRLTSLINFTGGKNNSETGKTRERRPITKPSDSDAKEEVAPPPRTSIVSPTIDVFDSNKAKPVPKYVDPEHRRQVENPDEVTWFEPIGPMG